MNMVFRDGIFQNSVKLDNQKCLPCILLLDFIAGYHYQIFTKLFMLENIEITTWHTFTPNLYKPTCSVNYLDLV